MTSPQPPEAPRSSASRDDHYPPNRQQRERAVFPGNIYARDVALPLQGRDRAAWRVASLLVCLAACRGGSASLEQLHVLTWAVREPGNGRELRAVWEGADGAPPVLRAWNSTLEDTVRLAEAAGLTEMTPTGRVTITAEGREVVRALRNDAARPLEQEQQFLASLGSISERGMWRHLGQRSSSGMEREVP